MERQRDKDDASCGDSIPLPPAKGKKACCSVLYSAYYVGESPKDATVLVSSLYASPAWLEVVRQMNRDVLCDSTVWTDFTMTTESAYARDGDEQQDARVEDVDDGICGGPAQSPNGGDLIPQQAKRILRRYFYDEFCQRLATRYGVPTLLTFCDRLKRGTALDEHDINHRWFVDSMLCGVRFVAALQITRPDGCTAAPVESESIETQTAENGGCVSAERTIRGERDNVDECTEGEIEMPFDYCGEGDEYTFDDADLALMPMFNSNLLRTPQEIDPVAALSDNEISQMLEDYEMELKGRAESSRQSHVHSDPVISTDTDIFRGHDGPSTSDITDSVESIRPITNTAAERVAAESSDAVTSYKHCSPSSERALRVRHTEVSDSISRKRCSSVLSDDRSTDSPVTKPEVKKARGVTADSLLQVPPEVPVVVRETAANDEITLRKRKPHRVIDSTHKRRRLACDKENHWPSARVDETDRCDKTGVLTDTRSRLANVIRPLKRRYPIDAAEVNREYECSVEKKSRLDEEQPGARSERFEIVSAELSDESTIQSVQSKPGTVSLTYRIDRLSSNIVSFTRLDTSPTVYSCSWDVNELVQHLRNLFGRQATWLGKRDCDTERFLLRNVTVERNSTLNYLAIVLREMW